MNIPEVKGSSGVKLLTGLQRNVNCVIIKECVQGLKAWMLVVGNSVAVLATT